MDPGEAAAIEMDRQVTDRLLALVQEKGIFEQIRDDVLDEMALELDREFQNQLREDRSMVQAQIFEVDSQLMRNWQAQFLRDSQQIQVHHGTLRVVQDFGPNPNLSSEVIGRRALLANYGISREVFAQFARDAQHDLDRDMVGLASMILPLADQQDQPPQPPPQQTP